MKRKITLSIALVVSVVLVSLTSSDSRVAAQQNQIRIIGDTGVVRLGPNQELRIMVSPCGELGPINTNVRFRQIGYTQSVCSDGICKYEAASQTTSDPITLTTGEAASFDISSAFLGGAYVGVRGIVLSNRQNVRVLGIVFDTSTQRVVSLMETVTMTCE